MPRLSFAALALLAATAAAQARKAPPADEGAYVARLGSDTVSAERFRRLPDGSYEIEQALNGPQAALRHVHYQLTPAGAPKSMMLMIHQIGAPDAPLLSLRTLTVEGDSATIEGKNGETAIPAQRIAWPAGTLPTIGGFNSQSWLTLELGARRARAAGRDSVQLTLVNLAGQGAPWSFVRLGRDSMRFVGPFVTYRARVDAAGRILGLHAPGSTFKVHLDRVPVPDIQALAASWKAKPMGVPSPADSVTASVGGATVALLYSRPSVRGRTTFGGELVPWNEVWRTGANAATVLRTDRDLDVGGTTVPAGSYTLWTISDPQGSRLIVSKLTKDPRGQPLWGTMYDPQYDLARIPLRRGRAPQRAEQFAIAVEGNLLTFTWDTTRMAVPIAPARP